HLDLDRPLSQVAVDKGQINQVFQNLLLNAKEAMPDGGNLFIGAENVTVDSKCERALVACGRYVKITFRDDGPGIDPAIIGKIFDPYFSSKGKGAKGQGLGLAISLSIIKKHGGYILVDSNPGAGATFSVYLPEAVEESASPHPGVESAVVAPPSPPPAATHQRLLVMEDEETVAAALCEMLSFLGYEAEVAGNGSEAIALFSGARERGEPFAAVILDLTIRGGEGGEKVLVRLREIDPQVKAIVASGYAENPIMSDFRRYGFDGALGKPFSLDHLAAEVRKVV
ncbi:MAG: ATP-binding protein, partial [Desulfobulbaceae bacterium]|nr:ATP-binding protein [Desulfobulbaceae bacterium]